MAKAVLGILLLFSVISWAIIAHKFRMFRKLRREAAAFLSVFYDQSSFATIYAASQRSRNNPFAALFAAGFQELRTLQMGKPARVRGGARLAEAEAEKRPIRSLGTVERSLKRAISVEARKLESSLSFLATTGSTAPFIGLFGTVWGVMNSFQGIGLRGSASLAVVAPGISEALIATAAGLAAAIPAVMGYNFFLSRTRALTTELENFAGDFLLLTEREILNQD
ncbi:MAG: MotA/TolQ/ExbB proton channel family protein [Candidatus Tectomicrobia bacterium]|nr:MotA/TolQ/ExbB proton channel family protein [Candidatus Tectomicrobia bacterium]